MLPSPPPYRGGFPPDDPRLPCLGRYPLIVGGQDIAHEAMQAFEQRHAPLKEVAYARTGREAEPMRETVETGAGPDEEYHPYERETPGAMQGLGGGMASGARHFYHAGKLVGYGLGALGGGITGMAYGGVKALVNASFHDSETDEDEAPVSEPVSPPRRSPSPPEEHRDVQPEQPVPAYLLDRGESMLSKPKKMKMFEKERIRIREKAAMDGVHPFRPFRPYP
jgi:hypothetical protein